GGRGRGDAAAVHKGQPRGEHGGEPCRGPEPRLRGRRGAPAGADRTAATGAAPFGDGPGGAGTRRRRRGNTPRAELKTRVGRPILVPSRHFSSVVERCFRKA